MYPCHAKPQNEVNHCADGNDAKRRQHHVRTAARAAQARTDQRYARYRQVEPGESRQYRTQAPSPRDSDTGAGVTLFHLAATDGSETTNTKPIISTPMPDSKKTISLLPARAGDRRHNDHPPRKQQQKVQIASWNPRQVQPRMTPPFQFRTINKTNGIHSYYALTRQKWCNCRPRLPISGNRHDNSPVLALIAQHCELRDGHLKLLSLPSQRCIVLIPYLSLMSPGSVSSLKEDHRIWPRKQPVRCKLP